MFPFDSQFSAITYYVSLCGAHAAPRIARHTAVSFAILQRRRNKSNTRATAIHAYRSRVLHEKSLFLAHEVFALHNAHITLFCFALRFHRPPITLFLFPL